MSDTVFSTRLYEIETKSVEITIKTDSEVIRRLFEHQIEKSTFVILPTKNNPPEGLYVAVFDKDEAKKVIDWLIDHGATYKKETVQ